MMRAGRLRGDAAGSIMLWVMVVGAFSLGALGMVASLIPNSAQLAKRYTEGTLSLVAAESGRQFLTDKIEKLEKELRDVNELTRVLNSGRFTSYTDEEAGYIYVRGTFGGSERILRAKLTLNPGQKEPTELAFPYAIYATGTNVNEPLKLTFYNASQIEGDVGANAPQQKLNFTNQKVFNGTLWPEKGDTFPIISKQQYLDDWLPGMRVVSPTVPGSPSGFPDVDRIFSGVSSKGDKTLGGVLEVVEPKSRYRDVTVSWCSNPYCFVQVGNANDTPIDVRFRTLTLGGNGNGLRVLPGYASQARIYVDETLTFGNEAAVNPNGSPENLVVYSAGTGGFTLTPASGTTANLHLFVKDIGNNTVTISGNFKGKVVILKGNLTIQGSGIFEGDVYVGEGNVTVNQNGNGRVIGDITVGVKGDVRITGSGKWVEGDVWIENGAFQLNNGSLEAFVGNVRIGRGTFSLSTGGSAKGNVYLVEGLNPGAVWSGFDVSVNARAFEGTIAVGEGSVHVQGSTQYTGDVLVEDGTIRISTSGTVRGNFLGGPGVDIYMNGSKEIYGLIYTPRGKVDSDPDPRIYGTVIGQVVDMDFGGNGKVVQQAFEATRPRELLEQEEGLTPGVSDWQLCWDGCGLNIDWNNLGGS